MSRPCFGQLEVADDLGPQQADDVAEDREPEAREDLLGDRRAAEDVALLEDERLQPGAGEVGGADQAVVAAADDDRVVGLGQGGRPPRLSRLHTFDASLAEAASWPGATGSGGAASRRHAARRVARAPATSPARSRRARSRSRRTSPAGSRSRRGRVEPERREGRGQALEVGRAERRRRRWSWRSRSTSDSGDLEAAARRDQPRDRRRDAGSALSDAAEQRAPREADRHEIGEAGQSGRQRLDAGGHEPGAPIVGAIVRCRATRRDASAKRSGSASMPSHERLQGRPRSPRGPPDRRPCRGR